MNGKDIIGIANYGGIGYWGEASITGNTVTVTSTEPGDFDPITFPLGNVAKAAAQVVAMYPKTSGASCIAKAIRENDLGYIDAEAADMIVQVAAFGEVVYG